MTEQIVSAPYATSSSLHKDVLMRQVKPTIRSFMGLTVGVFVLVVVIAIVGYAIRGDYEVAKAWLPLLIVVALGWLTMLPIHLRAIDKISASSGSGTTKYTFVIEKGRFTEKGSDETTTNLEAQDIAKTVLYEDCLVLWENSKTFHILPVVAFASESEMRRAYALLSS